MMRHMKYMHLQFLFEVAMKDQEMVKFLVD
jgi:hypothetical protein